MLNLNIVLSDIFKQISAYAGMIKNELIDTYPFYLCLCKYKLCQEFGVLNVMLITGFNKIIS